MLLVIRLASTILNWIIIFLIIVITTIVIIGIIIAFISFICKLAWILIRSILNFLRFFIIFIIFLSFLNWDLLFKLSTFSFLNILLNNHLSCILLLILLLNINNVAFNPRTVLIDLLNCNILQDPLLDFIIFFPNSHYIICNNWPWKERRKQ